MLTCDCHLTLELLAHVLRHVREMQVASNENESICETRCSTMSADLSTINGVHMVKHGLVPAIYMDDAPTICSGSDHIARAHEGFLNISGLHVGQAPVTLLNRDSKRLVTFDRHAIATGNHMPDSL